MKQHNNSRQLIGYIAVDTATCWVGDPCQIIDHSWDEYLATEPWKTVGPVDEPFGEGHGLAIHTNRDGGYPVYLETTEYTDDDDIVVDIKVKRVTIDFITDEE